METCSLFVTAAGRPSGSVLRFTGEINRDNVEEFRRALAHSIWMGLSEVDVDLVRITFLISPVIEALLQAERELARRNGRLRVLAGPQSAALFRLLGLDGVLQLTEVAPDRQVQTKGFALAGRLPLLDELPLSESRAPCELAALSGLQLD